MTATTGPLGPQPPPPATPPPQPPPAQPAQRTTGPLDGFKGAFGSLWGNLLNFFTPGESPPHQQAGSPPPAQNAIERMRDTVAEFDEDYRNIGERFLGAFQQFAGYVVPFIIVVCVGNELGAYFTPLYGGDGFSAYGISYAMEAAIAALTIALGRAFEHLGSGKADGLKVGLTLLGWILLQASSGLALYALAVNVPVTLPVGASAQTIQGILQIHMLMLIVRTIAVAAVDFGCAMALMWKGRSLQKHIEAIRKKATAITELADANRQTEEADRNAELRKKMMDSTLKIQDDLSGKIGEAVSMVMTSILEKMEKALKDDGGKKERGYGKTP